MKAQRLQDISQFKQLSTDRPPTNRVDNLGLNRDMKGMMGLGERWGTHFGQRSGRK